MDGKFVIFYLVATLVLQVSSSEFIGDDKQFADVERPASVDSGRGLSSPDEPKSESEEQNIINADPDLVDQTTSPTESITLPVDQENETTETSRNVLVEQTTLEVIEDLTQHEELTTLAEETHTTTHSIPTIHTVIESTTNSNPHSLNTTINSQVLDWKTPESVEDIQNTTVINVIDEETLPPNEHTSGVLSSTTTESFLTTLIVDTLSNSEKITTVETDNVDDEISSSVAPELPTPASTIITIPENSSANISSSITTNFYTQYTSTTLMSSPSENDMDTSVEEEATLSVFTDIPGASESSPIPVDPDIFQNTTTIQTETDLSVTYLTDVANEVTTQNNQSMTDDLNITSIETTHEELLATTTSNSLATKELLTSTLQPNNDFATLNRFCNDDKTCPDDEVCVSQVGECVCLSNVNAFPNQQLCQNLNNQEVVTPSNNIPTVDPNSENVANNSDLIGQRDFEHKFLTKKLKELSGKQRARNTISLSFSPAPEVAEWFQAYDWKFRKYIALALTACMQHSVVNKSDQHHTVTPSDIMYVAPSPLRDDKSLTVIILVLNPWSGGNTSFMGNKIIIGCLNESLQECETELQLTVSKIEGVFPKRLLGDCSINVAGLTSNSVKLLFIGAVVSLTLTVLSLVVLTLKCRQARGKFQFDPRSGLYRHPRVLTRSPGDGHNLATDEQCQQDEGRRRDPENGDVIGKGDADTWVVPLEEVQTTERDTNKDDNQDTNF